MVLVVEVLELLSVSDAVFPLSVLVVLVDVVSEVLLESDLVDLVSVDCFLSLMTDKGFELIDGVQLHSC